ncbi:MAG: nucleotidyl transferase AbiEii/AbiGii toxin family protein [Prolixibacteraceae bacterium]|nr:nucleotidyl transferase AbiEii/AbiGii toxin family protein [Prolixibacteraceae bacterium]
MINIIKEIAKRLEDAGIAYMFTGSTALNFYATPRMTRDIDIVVELHPEDAKKIYELFEKDFYIDATMIYDAIKRHGMFNIIHSESVFKVDFIVRKDNPYRLEEFQRKKQMAFEGMDIFIVAPEDLILSKLAWIKETMSELQMRDIRSMLQSVKGLDFVYLDKWADYLGVTEIYRQVNG